MAQGQHGDELVLDQQLGVETFVGQDDEADVDAAFGDPVGDHVVRALVDVDLDLRVIAAVLIEDARQQQQRRRRPEGADAQHAAVEPAHRCDLLRDGFRDAEDFARPRQQVAPDLGHLDPGLAAREQGDAPFAFQLLERVRHRRLADPEPFGGGGEATEVGDEDEDFELGEGHLEAPLIHE